MAHIDAVMLDTITKQVAQNRLGHLMAQNRLGHLGPLVSEPFVLPYESGI